jgi:hypothetical protein
VADRMDDFEWHTVETGTAVPDALETEETS